MRNVSFVTKTSSGPKTGSRTESRDPLRGVSYTVGAGEATVVCRKRNEGEAAGRGGRAACGGPGEDLGELKLVGFVEMSGNFGAGLVRKGERR
jgi:hypothetical protein